MNESERKWLVFNYAWRWFEYHASQRLIAFRFYLIIIGAVGWVFLRKNLSELGNYDYCFLGIALFVVSLFFYFLEVRNNQLVNHGRDALDEVEKDLGLIDTKYAIRHNDQKNRKCFATHSFVITAFYGIIAGIGLILVGRSFCP